MISSFGRETRTNMARLIDQLKVMQRDHARLNNDFESTIDKNSTSEF